MEGPELIGDTTRGYNGLDKVAQMDHINRQNGPKATTEIEGTKRQMNWPKEERKNSSQTI
jgi:hypothetical protein